MASYGVLRPSLSSYVLRDAPRFYREKVTGAHNDRRELLDMLKHLAPGDTVIVTRIDRLARSTFYLFGIVKRSWMPRRNSDPRRNRGPTPFPHHTRATQRGHPTPQGATLQKLAHGYNVGISTIRRATRTA